MMYNKELVKNAYKNAPMYMKLIQAGDKEDIKELPVIDKNYVIENESGAIAADSIMLYYADKLIKTRTSGSTGKYMEIFWKHTDYKKSMMPLWLLRKKYYGIEPNDKLCFFFTLGEEKYEERNKIVENNQVGYSKSNLTMESIRDIYMDICEERPKWMLLQPSMAVLLCQCVRKYGLSPVESLKYIEFSGEILTEQVRNDVKEVFGCAVANQYGANEFNSIAYECPCGNMHVMISNVYVEVMIDNEAVPEGTEGELIITTKTNTAMPLIRYKIGDMGCVKKSSCNCGNSKPVLELTSGRTNDWILCENGEKKMAYVLVRAIDCINNISEGAIKQFQIIQKAVNKFVINLVMDEDEREYFVAKGMEQEFKKYIADDEVSKSEFVFEYYDEMFPEQILGGNGLYNGKFKYFIREI